jgi:hypothetical protein
VPVDEYLGAKTPDVGNSGNPGISGNPANPRNSGNPGNPGNPNDPGNRGVFGNPNSPGSPGNPGNPGEPGSPSDNNASHNGTGFGAAPYIPSLAALTVVGAGVNVPGNQLTQVTPILPRPMPVKDSLGDPAKANTQQIPYPYKAPVYLPRQERN